MVSFRDDLIADDEQHGARCEAQGPGHQGLGQPHEGSTEQATQGFGKAGHEGDGECLGAGIIDGKQGKCHCQPFRDVLKPDAGGQHVPVIDVAASKTDTHGHALGKVVKGDGDNEKPDAANIGGVRSFPAQLKVLVWQSLVNEIERGSSR